MRPSWILEQVEMKVEANEFSNFVVFWNRCDVSQFNNLLVVGEVL